MAVETEANTVTEVLLADGWHRVENRSFWVSEDHDWVGPDMDVRTRNGFVFKELLRDGHIWVTGPLSSVLAVRELDEEE